MKKLLFTIVFLSVISFVGISKVNALPIGSVYENWETNKKFAGQFYSNNGALMPFYAYNGTGSMSCPYLDVQNELSPLGCYLGNTYRAPGQGSSFLVNSLLCTQGNCTTGGSVVNLVFYLYNDAYANPTNYFVPGENYHIRLDIGVKSDYITTLHTFLNSAYNLQNNDGTSSNLAVNCYLYSETGNIYGRSYCSLEFDYVPAEAHYLVFMDFASGIPMVDLNYNIEWLLYPLVTQNPVSNLEKYTMNSNQYAFISGITSGRVTLPESYWLSDGSYLNYFDINRDTQPYSSYIPTTGFTEYMEYMYYDYDINSYAGSELVMLSTNAWSNSNYPYKTIDFYVPKNAYVDIVDFNPVGNVGNSLSFDYKNPYTGAVQNIVVNSYALDSNSGTLFANITSGLDLFRQPILSIGSIFSEFFNNINSPLGWFFIILFSFGVLSIMLALFM